MLASIFCPIKCDTKCEADKARILALEQAKFEQEELVRQQEFEASEARLRATEAAADAEKATADAKAAAAYAQQLQEEAIRDETKKAEANAALATAQQKAVEATLASNNSATAAKRAQEELLRLNSAIEKFKTLCRDQNDKEEQIARDALIRCNTDKGLKKTAFLNEKEKCNGLKMYAQQTLTEIRTRMDAETARRARRRREEEEAWAKHKQRAQLKEFWKKEARLLPGQIFEQGDILGDPDKEGFWLTLDQSGEIKGYYHGYQEDNKPVDFPASFTTIFKAANDVYPATFTTSNMPFNPVSDTRPKRMRLDRQNGDLMIEYQDMHPLWFWPALAPNESQGPVDLILRPQTGELALRSTVNGKTQETRRMQLQNFVGFYEPLRQDVVYSDGRFIWKIDRISPYVLVRRRFENDEAVRQNGFDPNNPSQRLSVHSSVLQQYPVASPIAQLPNEIRNGRNYECNGTVYRIEKGKKRPYATLAAFYRDNYLQQIEQPRPACSFLARVPDGDAIN